MWPLSYCGTAVSNLILIFHVEFNLRFLSRVKELQAAKLVVKKLLPWSFFNDDTFKEMMATVAGNSAYPELDKKRVKHLIVELYCATKKVKVEVEKLKLELEAKFSHKRQPH